MARAKSRASIALHVILEVMILAVRGIRRTNQTEFPFEMPRISACRKFLTRRFELVLPRSVGLRVQRVDDVDERNSALFVVRLPFCPITRWLPRFSYIPLDFAVLRQNLLE